MKTLFAAMAALTLLAGCDGKPTPGATWAPGEPQLSGTVRSKEIVLIDPQDPGKGIKCYQIVLERQAGTSEHCVGKEEWVRAQPGHLMSWD